MVSDEAVEAAAKVIALSTGHIMESDWEWEHLPKEGYYKTAREALEVAASLMLADAWDEGAAAESAMWCESAVPCGACDKCESQGPANPYRIRA